MNQASWERLADAVDVKFGISGHGNLERPLEDRPELTEKVNFIEFEKSGETFRLEHVTRPAIIDKKSFHGKAATSGVRFENIYDPNTLTSKVDVFRRQGDELLPVELEDISLG